MRDSVEAIDALFEEAQGLSTASVRRATYDVAQTVFWRPTPEQRRADYKRRRDQGICVRCNSPALPEHSMCADHLREHRDPPEKKLERIRRRATVVARDLVKLEAEWTRLQGKVEMLARARRNAMRDALVLCHESGDPEPIEQERQRSGTAPTGAAALPGEMGITFAEAVSEFENKMILQALERCPTNKGASKLLGLNRTTLVEMLKRKHLAPERRARQAARETMSIAEKQRARSEADAAQNKRLAALGAYDDTEEPSSDTEDP